MPRLAPLPLLALALLAPALAATPAPSVPAAIRSCSVTVETEDGGGSGTLLKGADGRVWCLTAAHVVGEAKAVKVCRHLTDPDGRQYGAWVGAEVEKADADVDLALLRLGRRAPGACGFARLYAGDEPPPADSPIYSCGSARLTFHHQLLRGHVTTLGRRLDGRMLDESDVTGGPGTSGAGVYLRRTGELIGVHVASDGVRGSLFVPARVVRPFLGDVLTSKENGG